MSTVKKIILFVSAGLSVGFLVAFACVLAAAMPHFDNLSVAKNGARTQAQVQGYSEEEHFGKMYYGLSVTFDGRHGKTPAVYDSAETASAKIGSSVNVRYQILDGAVRVVEEGYAGGPGTAALTGCTYAFSIIGGLGLIATAVYAAVALTAARKSKQA